jgi:hypothetical protein
VFLVERSFDFPVDELSAWRISAAQHDGAACACEIVLSDATDDIVRIVALDRLVSELSRMIWYVLEKACAKCS